MGSSSAVGVPVVKGRLYDAPMLVFLDPKLPDTVVRDASGTTVGGVLM